MSDDKKNPQETPQGKISQVSLLNEMVFNSELPLKPPPKPTKKRLKRPLTDHGPDYDPETLDLFDELPPQLEEPRADSSKVIDGLVEEYSEEISRCLREELTEQLGSILDELTQPAKDDLEDSSEDDPEEKDA